MTRGRHRTRRSSRRAARFRSLIDLTTISVRLLWSASRPLTVGMAAGSAVTGLIPPAQALVGGLLVDGVITGVVQRSMTPVVWPVVLEMLLGVAASVTARLQAACQNLLIARVRNHTGTLIAAHASTLDLASFENADFYNKLNRAQTDGSIRPMQLVSHIFDLVANGISALSVIGILARLNGLLALILLVTPIPALIVDRRLSRLTFNLRNRQSDREREQGYFSTLLTNIAFVKEMKLFNLAPLLLGRYARLGRDMYHETRALERTSLLSTLPLSIVSAAAGTGVYLYIATKAIARQITIGQLTQYSIAAQTAGRSIQALFAGIGEIYQQQLFLTNLQTFLREKPTIVAPESPVPLPDDNATLGAAPRGHLRLIHTDSRRPAHSRPQRVGAPTGSHGRREFADHRSAPPPLIELRDVTFQYPGTTTPSVNRLSFDIYPGERVAIVGENGAGKTTLVKLLTRLYDPTSGRIRFAGHDLADYNPAALRDAISVVLQDFNRYDMRVRDNIGLGDHRRTEDLDRIITAARESGADPIIQRLPDDYHTMLGHFFTDSVDLSGGQWQRIAMARAFLRADTRLIILDEPTSALDARAEHDVVDRFLHLAAGRTVIFISHRFSTIRLADRILVVDGGQIIEEGDHHQLLNRNGHYARLFRLQAAAYQDETAEQATTT